MKWKFSTLRSISVIKFSRLVRIVNWYSENNVLLQTESENRFQNFALFEMKYATYTEPYNFVVHEADEDLQTEILELQCHLVSKWKFFMSWYRDLETYISAHRFIIFLAKYVLFLVTCVSEQLFLLLKRNMSSEWSRSTDKHLPSVMNVAST